METVVAVVAMVTVVAVSFMAHVVGTVVRVVVRIVMRHSRVEAVGRLALSALMFHRVVMALSVWSLVATLAHLLDLVDPVAQDALPFTIQRPLIALLVLVRRRGLNFL